MHAIALYIKKPDQFCWWLNFCHLKTAVIVLVDSSSIKKVNKPVLTTLNLNLKKIIRFFVRNESVVLFVNKCCCGLVKCGSTIVGICKKIIAFMVWHQNLNF